MKTNDRLKIIQMQEAAAHVMRTLGPPPPAECCLRCENLADDNNCLKWNQKVPDEYLKTSCEGFLDIIPF